jgi:hypothetical protein
VVLVLMTLIQDMASLKGIFERTVATVNDGL